MPVEIRTRTSPSSRGVPTQIDALFVPAKVASGKLLPEAKQIRSLDDYAALGLVRADNTLAYDGLDNYFREGGRRAVVGTYQTDVTKAFDQFVPEFGGGQLVAWDEPPASAHTALLARAQADMRFALMDVALADDTAAELQTAAAGLPTSSEYGSAFGPWVEIGPLASSSGGGNRTVPATSTVAGLIARADAQGNPNVAPAGRDFALQNATSVSSLSDVEANALRSAGLNPLRLRLGLQVLDGFRTSDNKNPEVSPFWQANCGRTRMWLQWNSLAIGLGYEYKTIDGRGRLLRSLQSELSAMCKTLWEADGLFGDSPSQAYSVDVSATINPVDEIAQGIITAVVQARLSMHAETVIIELVSVPVNGAVV